MKTKLAALAAGLLLLSGCAAPDGADSGGGLSAEVPSLHIAVFDPLGYRTLSGGTEVYDTLRERAGMEIQLRYDPEDPVTQLSILASTGEIPDIVVLPFDYTRTRRICGMKLAFPLRDVSDALYRREAGRSADFLSYQGELYAVTGGETGRAEGLYLSAALAESFGKQGIPAAEQLPARLRQAGGSLVLDTEQAGFRTLERLFGLYSQNGEAGGRRLLAFLRESGTTGAVQPRNETRLLEALEEPAVLFAGRRDMIARYNALHPGSAYAEWTVPGDLDGFCATDPGFGRYVSFIGKTDAREAAVRLLEYLTGPEGEALMRYGVENRHYIRTDTGVHVLGWVEEKRTRDPAGLVRETGIRSLPYFLSGTEEPPAAGVALSLLSAALPLPTDPGWRDVQEVKDTLDRLYQDMLAGRRSQAEGEEALSAVLSGEAAGRLRARFEASGIQLQKNPV